MIQINAPVIKNYPLDLKTCIKEDTEHTELPIGKGWGYGPEDALSVETAGEPMAREAVIVEVIRYRIDYELIHMRPAGQHYEGIQWKITERSHPSIDGVVYECIRCQVQAHTAEDWDALRHMYAKTSKQPDFSKEEHMAMHNELMRTYVGEFWFKE